VERERRGWPYTGPPRGHFLLNLWRRSLADRDSLLLSLRRLCGERSSGQQAPGRYTWPPRFLLLFSFFLLVLWAGDSSLLAQDSGRAEYKAGKLWRVGIISHSAASSELAGPEPQSLTVKSLLHGLRELGYVYGEHFVTEVRGGEAKPERYRALAAELVHLRVDVIVASGGMLSALKQATATIPIVMAASSDPVAEGLVQNLSRPDGNFTGLSHQIVDTTAKRLELLKELVPGAAPVAMIRDRWSVLTWRAAEAAARARGWKLLSLEVGDAGDLARIMREG
jgi:hypothetical protein